MSFLLTREELTKKIMPSTDWLRSDQAELFPTTCRWSLETRKAGECTWSCYSANKQRLIFACFSFSNTLNKSHKVTLPVNQCRHHFKVKSSDRVAKTQVSLKGTNTELLSGRHTEEQVSIKFRGFWWRIGCGTLPTLSEYSIPQTRAFQGYFLWTRLSFFLCWTRLKFFFSCVSLLWRSSQPRILPPNFPVQLSVEEARIPLAAPENFERTPPPQLFCPIPIQVTLIFLSL